MKRKAYGRDAGLSFRMLFTTSLLGLLYVLFAVALFYLLNAGLILMVVIVGGMAFFQYFTSDKIALAASGAKVVGPEEAPQLHEMIERLCALADLPKPRVAVIESDMPNAFATGRNKKHAAVAVTTGLWNRLEPREVEGVLAHERGERPAPRHGRALAGDEEAVSRLRRAKDGSCGRDDDHDRAISRSRARFRA